ncbi:DUF3566 domain-containing protein [Streptomyces sp. IBSBF 3136]|uniref:DUF3566 domain-containing protein n=1 Tax=Streptomyces sp. IBSBF 3136 TaxID=2903524 RepID=UPI002FDBB647
MGRTRRSRTPNTVRERTQDIVSRAVAAPTRDHTLPHAPPRRPTRLRISQNNPWSITVMSFLFLGSLGVCVLGAVLATSVIMAVVAPGAGPSLSQTLFIAAVVVAGEILLGTAVACLCGFTFNHTARLSGGLEVALTDDLADPAPAGGRGEEAREAPAPADTPS